MPEINILLFAFLAILHVFLSSVTFKNKYWFLNFFEKYYKSVKQFGLFCWA